MLVGNSKLHNKTYKAVLSLLVALLVQCPISWAKSEPSRWLVTAYCACKKCCGPKAKGITASGKRVKPGYIALNWLPFGTKVLINGKPYVVEDRGAESLFGTYYHRKQIKSRIKHIDIYMPSHSDALRFGKQYLPVEILK